MVKNQMFSAIVLSCAMANMTDKVFKGGKYIGTNNSFDSSKIKKASKRNQKRKRRGR